MRYSFDEVPAAGRSHRYRLRQIDADGSFAFSPEVTVEMAPASAQFYLAPAYPNPSRGGTTLRIVVPADPGPVAAAPPRLLLHDAAGRETADLTALLRNALQRIDAGGIAVLQLARDLFPRSGTYYCTLIAPAASVTRAMVIE